MVFVIDDFHIRIIDTPGFFDTDGHNPGDHDYIQLKSQSRTLQLSLREYKKQLLAADERSFPGKGRAKVTEDQNEIDAIEQRLEEKRTSWRAEQVNKSIMAACECNELMPWKR